MTHNSRRQDSHVVVASLPGSYVPTVIDLRDWRGDSGLRVQLADAIEILTGVNGSWTSAFSARSSATRIRLFATWCASQGISDLGHLSPDLWNAYLLYLGNRGSKNTTQSRQLSSVRQVLRCYPDRLHPDLPKFLRRRLPPKEEGGSQPYPDRVFKAIQKAATAAVDAEFNRIAPNLSLLRRRGQSDLSEEERVRADALYELAIKGAPQSASTRDALGVEVADDRSMGVNKARPLLFVTHEGAIAIAVLIACLEGTNFTPISERKVPSAAPGIGVSEELWTVEDVKRKRHEHPYDPHAIPKNARRATGKIIAMTGPAREYLAANGLPGADRLIAYWPSSCQNGSAPFVGLKSNQIKLKKLTWWSDEDESISFVRIRKTVRVAIDRTPQGHSRATWSSNYIESSEVERERLREQAVESGLWAVVEKAEEHLKMRFRRSVSAEPEKDTVVGGCVDSEHNPLTNGPCGDDFLLCLQCTNAFATPRHLPRLIELRSQLEAIASADGPDWTNFRAQAYGCLLALIDDRTLINQADYDAAARAVTDVDRQEIQLLLNGRYT